MIVVFFWSLFGSHFGRFGDFLEEKVDRFLVRVLEGQAVASAHVANPSKTL